MEEILALIKQSECVSDFNHGVLEKHEVPNDNGFMDFIPHRWYTEFTLQLGKLELIINYRTYIPEDYYKITRHVYDKFGRV